MDSKQAQQRAERLVQEYGDECVREEAIKAIAAELLAVQREAYEACEREHSYARKGKVWPG